MSSELELLEAQIRESQTSLREMHATKHRIKAESQRRAIEQETLGTLEGQNTGLTVVAVTQQGPGVPGVAPTHEGAGFPTSRKAVDMTQAQPVQVQQNFTVQAEPPKPGPPSREKMFMEGAISGLAGSRGPQKVVLFPRKRA
jgi:hypothetical protein